MNSINPKLNWKAVTKGRRSRKSVARSFDGAPKAGSISPKRVGDFSGSDSDKLSVPVVAQTTPGISDYVPVKKRRHLCRPPSPQPRIRSLHCQDSPSPQLNSSVTPSEGQDQHLHPNYSSRERSLNSYPNLQLRGLDGLATLSKQAGEDFSGIELLAAAASMEDCADNVNKKAHVVEECPIPGSSDASVVITPAKNLVEDCSIPGNSVTSVVITPSKSDLKCNELGNSLSTANLCGDSASCLLVSNKCTPTSQGPSGSMTVGSTSKCISKVDRRHWDLNTEMDAWEEPYDDSIAGNISKDATDFHMHLEGSKEGSKDHGPSNPGDIGVESSTLKSEVEGVTPDRTFCTESPILEEHPLKQATNSHSSAAAPTSDQAIEKDVGEHNPNQVASGDADLETPSQVKSSDANLDISCSKLHCSASILVAEEKNNMIMQTLTQDVDMPGAEERKTFVHVTCKREFGDNFNSNSDEFNYYSPVSKSGTFLASGAFANDEKHAVVADSKVWNNENRSRFERNELVAKHEDGELPNVGLEKIMLEDSCDSYSAQIQYDDCTTTAGKLYSTSDPHPDSPYEDGELRGSFLYSWEENELEPQCVDYESDGRKEEGWDAADNRGSEIVEGGSEGSHGTEGRSSMMKKSPEGNERNRDLVKHPLRRNLMKDDSKDHETCGKKESNGGSGTTVEQCMEMVIDESNDTTKRRILTNRTDIDDCRALMGEYVSRMARGKLQSRTERRASLEAADANDVLFIRPCRSRRVGGFHERDVSPEKYAGRYRPATRGSEKDGVYQLTKCGSRGRYSSTYRGTGGLNGTRARRSITGDLVDKFGESDFHEQRQTAGYLYRDFQRPLVRTRSPVDRYSNFGMRQRMPPARRFNSYKSRGDYLQTANKDFGDDFEPMPSGASAPVRFSRIPKRERSFSPHPSRDAHVPLTRRRSRSRSSTRSPGAWNSYRDGNFGTRRHNRSPDFRSDARMERMKVPFHKPSFASEYREGYMSPPRGRFSPQRNSHWVGDRNFSDNRFNRKRSPIGVVRGNNQSFNSVNSSGRLKSDEYFRPMNRPRRFFYGDNDSRESKFGTNCDDRKLGDRGGMHQGKQRDDGRNFRRFQHDVYNDIETSNLNDKEGTSNAVPRDVTHVQGDKENKKESESD